ncbi:hypothetical protein Mal52_13560 [Symmachiella dynata]|uniref:Uncharacterized protein n=1 Tax=Symmachiella dynata TaxID=2527995 RepID=A0A517ZKA2_9PLAN|nr:hypothetical protein [Symmachiella dynata]QDU42887.1 hypothetical protein Mal52_13560 [Symmachiella dynata]
MTENRVYAVEGDAAELIESQVADRVAALMEKLATDDATRQAVSKNDAKLLQEFDKIRDQLACSDDTDLSITSLISIQNDGAGLEPGTILILVTLGPPLVEHVVGPVAVHVCTSVWDNFILPELVRWFKKFEPK